MTDDPGRVNLTCECGQRHTVVWPTGNPVACEIRCTPECGRALEVNRDGSGVGVKEERESPSPEKIMEYLKESNKKREKESDTPNQWTGTESELHQKGLEDARNSVIDRLDGVESEFDGEGISKAKEMVGFLSEDLVIGLKPSVVAASALYAGHLLVTSKYERKTQTEIGELFGVSSGGIRSHYVDIIEHAGIQG